MKEPKVFALLTLISVRARRTNGLNIHGLALGEAFIGDHSACGLTKQEYRTAKMKLEKWNLVTFRSTNKGTIATILDTSIYDINMDIDQPASKPTTNQPTTNSQPSTNQQATTNNNFKKEKKDKEITTTGTYAVDDDIFPEILKKKFGQIGMTPEGARKLYNNCDQNTDIMLEWVIWGISQSNAKNSAGLIISESKRNSKPPFVSRKYQTEKNDLLEKETYN